MNLKDQIFFILQYPAYIFYSGYIFLIFLYIFLYIILYIFLIFFFQEQFEIAVILHGVAEGGHFGYAIASGDLDADGFDGI